MGPHQWYAPHLLLHVRRRRRVVCVRRHVWVMWWGVRLIFYVRHWSHVAVAVRWRRSAVVGGGRVRRRRWVLLLVLLLLLLRGSVGLVPLLSVGAMEFVLFGLVQCIAGKSAKVASEETARLGRHSSSSSSSAHYRYDRGTDFQFLLDIKDFPKQRQTARWQRVTTGTIKRRERLPMRRKRKHWSRGRRTKPAVVLW